MKSAIIVLGCDLVNGGASLGPETTARCRKAMLQWAILSRRSLDPMLIMTPGISPDRARYPNQRETMAAMMASWFMRQGVRRGSLSWCFSGNVWGTRAELRSAIWLIVSQVEKMQLDFPVHVEIVSSSYHLRRIGLVTRRIIKNAKREHLMSVSLQGVPHPSDNPGLEGFNMIAESILGFVRPKMYDIDV